LQSSTLAHLLAHTGATSDAGGAISVILSRNDTYYLPRFDPANITNAVVSTEALPHHAGC
jgi:hypothetical protein